ncbi:3-isopropylmalate dehydrogenase [Robertkochia sediminum]|uniref:3-isopropylmalate dehydrogenase n=1 Tax=Robertkochia sediminum TaxID=2785326 RepID=UPI001934B5EE|nr:3-isopropylmalate dehydrogenase [Robertkochia sediminum]MBL7473780.1 3-isopropylmalate dehydrogenase [Robertkochia sediminum]
MNFKIAVLPGDGIGPEVTEQAIKCLKVVGDTFEHNFTFEEAPVGAVAIDKTGDPLPEATLELCKNSDAVLFGAIGDPKYDNDPSARVRPEQGLLKLRKELGLFTNIRPIKAYTSLIDRSPLRPDRIKNTDMTIYRELTGGIYFGEKKLNEEGTLASDLCEYSEKEIERIAHQAFKAARTRKNKVTLVDKANVLETSRLWRKVVTKVGESYPEVELDFLFVDNAAMQMILNPSQFDVILTENMFGDIISDEGSVIGGSIGLLASASVGDKHGLFEPVHGSFPQGKGQNIANPVASILSAVMLLEYLGLNEEAHALDCAVTIAIEREIVTEDLKPGSRFGTKEVGDHIASLLADEGDKICFDPENIEYGKSTII